MKFSRLVSPKEKRAAAALMAASDPWLRLGLGAAACLKSLNAPLREIYAAREGRDLAGLVIINMHGAFRGYVQTLFVAPAFRGRGAGEALMRLAERKIFARSPNVFLCVSSFNRGAIKFYRRLGYTRAGVIKDFFKKGSDEHLMRKTLGPLQAFNPRRKTNG